MRHYIGDDRPFQFLSDDSRYFLRILSKVKYPALCVCARLPRMSHHTTILGFGGIKVEGGCWLAEGASGGRTNAQNRDSGVWRDPGRTLYGGIRPTADHAAVGRDR